MILGPDGEAKMVDGWKQKYKTDMFTSSQNQVNVLKAMKKKNSRHHRVRRRSNKSYTEIVHGRYHCQPPRPDAHCCAPPAQIRITKRTGLRRSRTCARTQHSII